MGRQLNRDSWLDGKKSVIYSTSTSNCLFGHVARLRRDVPANQILQICTKTRDGQRPSPDWRCACGQPSTTWTHQICRDTGVTATEALQLAEDWPFWRTIATAGGSSWTLRGTMMMNVMLWHYSISKLFIQKKSETVGIGKR